MPSLIILISKVINHQAGFHRTLGRRIKEEVVSKIRTKAGFHPKPTSPVGFQTRANQRVEIFRHKEDNKGDSPHRARSRETTREVDLIKVDNSQGHFLTKTKEDFRPQTREHFHLQTREHFRHRTRVVFQDKTRAVFQGKIKDFPRTKEVFHPRVKLLVPRPTFQDSADFSQTLSGDLERLAIGSETHLFPGTSLEITYPAQTEVEITRISSPLAGNCL